MQKTTFLFSLLGSFALNAGETQLKGVLLVNDSSKVRTTDLEAIEGVQFDGVSPPGGDEVLAQELLNSEYPLTTNGAERLCAAIASIYRTHDDLRMSVTMPDQDTSNGVVQFVAAPERLGKLNVKESRYTHPEVLKRWVRLSANDAINEKVLTQDVGWMNTNPFRNVEISYKNADQPGVTDVDLIVKDKGSWKASIGVDNTGTNPIGTTRIFTGLDIGDFIFTDHTLNFQVTAADHYSEYQSYSAQYVAPLPWRNTLRVYGSYSQTKPKREEFPQKNRQSYQANIRYAVPQWFGLNPWADQITYEAGFDFKGTNTNLQFENNPAPVEDKFAYIGQFVGNISALRKREGSKISAGIDLVGSPVRTLPNQTDADFSNLREGAIPRYFYSRLKLAVEQEFFKKWNVFVQGRGQFSPSNLIPSEQFSLGGYSTVRGYEERVVGGDNAVCGNFEIRTPKYSPLSLWLPKVEDSLAVIGFVDAGYAWFNEAVPKTPLDQALLGVGPGLRYSISSYFSSRFDVGFPLMKVEKDSNKPRVHFNAIWSY